MLALYDPLTIAPTPFAISLVYPMIPLQAHMKLCNDVLNSVCEQHFCGEGLSNGVHFEAKSHKYRAVLFFKLNNNH